MKNGNKKTFVFYKIFFYGFLIQVLSVLAKLTGLFDFSWGYVFIPIIVTYAILILPMVAILFKVLADNTKEKFKQQNM